MYDVLEIFPLTTFAPLYNSYAVTPTLSVAAFQPRVILVEVELVTVRFAGAVGAEVSVLAEALINLASNMIYDAWQ